MPLYLIERDFSGFTLPEIEAAAVRGRLCSIYFEGINWVRSFFDEARYLSRCIYEATTPNEAREHAHAGGLPCDHVRAVSEIRSTEAGNLTMDASHGDGTPIRDETGATSLWMARHGLGAQDDRLLLQSLDHHRTLQPDWLRSYVDREAGELISIYRGTGLGEAPEAARTLGLTLLAIEPTIENIPSDFSPKEEPLGAAR